MQGVAVGPPAVVDVDQAQLRERVDMARRRLGAHLPDCGDPLEPRETEIGVFAVLIGQDHEHELAKRIADVLAHGPGHRAHAHGAATPESGLVNARDFPTNSMPLFRGLGNLRH